jgi:hypothetical protein
MRSVYRTGMALGISRGRERGRKEGTLDMVKMDLFGDWDCVPMERLLCCTLLDDTLGDCLEFFSFFDHDICVVGCERIQMEHVQ